MARKAEPTFITEQKPFPKRLRKLLDENSVSQARLADFVGVTRQAISLYATGQSTPDINVFCKIADYFDVPYDYLLGKTISKKRENIDINKITGLNDEAIERLKQFKSMGFNNMISKIIYNINLISALDQISRLLSLKLKQGEYHAIVPNADYERLKNGGKGKALMVNSSVIETMFTARAKEDMTKIIDDILKEVKEYVVYFEDCILKAKQWKKDVEDGKMTEDEFKEMLKVIKEEGIITNSDFIEMIKAIKDMEV